MARAKKTVYERIIETQSEINQLEENLKELKSKLVSLNKEKDDLEMRQIFAFIKEQNITYDQAMKLLKR